MQREVRIEPACGEDTLPGRAGRAIAVRAAARRAIEALGYPGVRRRRITPPPDSPLRAGMSQGLQPLSSEKNMGTHHGYCLVCGRWRTGRAGR